MLAALWSVGSRLYEVCDVFNGRSPKSLTSLKLLRAVIEHAMIMSITFVQCEEDETNRPDTSSLIGRLGNNPPLEVY